MSESERRAQTRLARSALWYPVTIAVLFAAMGCADDTGRVLERVEVADTDAPIQTDADSDAPTDRDVGPDSAPVPSVDDVISRAGNSEDEAERYRELDSLLGHPDLDESLRADLRSLLPIIDQWAHGRDRYWEPGDQETSGEGGYLAGFFNLQVWPSFGSETGPTYPARVDRDSPLYPIWALYRGRMLIWSGIQTGTFVSTASQRDDWYGEARTLLDVAQEAFPDNRVIGMYLDTPIPWPAIEDDPDAPAWANLQREALTKLAEIISFWIAERQAPDGQFGGGWGDDVEMWRWWTPVLVGFADQQIIEAQALLSNGIFSLPRLERGYSSIMTDVEHSAEDSSDAITAMLLARPDDLVWQGRAERIAELMADVWMARNERDQLQFQSAYFTDSSVSTNSSYACDTLRHSRAVQPVLHRWQQSGDDEMGALLTDWLDTWVDAAAREERGKGAGILPSAIHWPSGEVGGPGAEWWDPGCALNPGAFEYPSALAPMARALVLAWHMTGDAGYLAPIESMAALRREFLATSPESPQEGSAMWAAQSLGRVSEALARYRAVSGDGAYDDLILADSDGYVRYRLTGDESALLAGLETTVASLRINRESYTSETRYTDRVLKFARNYANHYAPSRLPSPDTQLLYEMVTGDFGDPLYFPLPALRWETSPRDFAAFVRNATVTRVEAETYLFDGAGREVGVALPNLAPGPYAWDLSCDDLSDEHGEIEVLAGGGHLLLDLPGRTRCTLVLEPS